MPIYPSAFAIFVCGNGGENSPPARQRGSEGWTRSGRGGLYAIQGRFYP